MNKKFKYLISLVVIMVLLAGCGTTNKNTSASSSKSKTTSQVLNSVQDSGVLKVGFEGTYPPFNFADKNNNYDGFDVDISNEIAKRLGVKAEFVAAQWDSLIGGLKADKFDIIIAQMAITEERKKSVDFTDPYVITGTVIIKNKETKGINKKDDLKGKTIGAVGGSTFEQMARSIDSANVRIYKTTGDEIQDLTNKRIDAVLNDPLYMGYNIKTNNLPLESSNELLDKLTIGMAVKKDNSAFVDKINQVLKDMKQDGTYKTIFKKWFGIEPMQE